MGGSEFGSFETTSALGEYVWCELCQTRHFCDDDHGPDGHGGSSICCPVKRAAVVTHKDGASNKAIFFALLAFVFALVLLTILVVTVVNL